MLGLMLWEGRSELFGPEGGGGVMENVTESGDGCNFERLRTRGTFLRRQERVYRGSGQREEVSEMVVWALPLASLCVDLLSFQTGGS